MFLSVTTFEESELVVEIRNHPKNQNAFSTSEKHLNIFQMFLRRFSQMFTNR